MHHQRIVGGFRALSHGILGCAHKGLLRFDFLQEVCMMVSEFSGCDSVEIWIKEHNHRFCGEVSQSRKSFRFEIIPPREHEANEPPSALGTTSSVADICWAILNGDPETTPISTVRQFKTTWTGDAARGLSVQWTMDGRRHTQRIHPGDSWRSVALIPIAVEDSIDGVLQLKSIKKNYFTQDEIDLYQDVAQTLGDAFVQRRTGVSLRERVKELRCLYGIVQLALQPGLTIDTLLQSIVELLPPAWLYPEITSAQISFDDKVFFSTSAQHGHGKQEAEIVVNGATRGKVEVVLSAEKPELDEGPFMKEERRLIDTVAGEIGLLIERKLLEKERSRLLNQLMHADRLATIGQLAAGVAHELNEPLESILGFSQLVKKSSELNSQTQKDIERIIKASLHAREVVKKLVTFARQQTPEKVETNLNTIVEDGLYFLESRCAKAGIKVMRELCSNLPAIAGDPVQLHQALVNIVANAIQAMPLGGTLTIRTHADDLNAWLTVEDTGIGMNEEVLKNIFTPFFTTKGAGQGTGLGLSVVHGIVSSHGGSIRVESKPGQGSLFEIRIPLTNVRTEHLTVNRNETAI